MNIKTEHPRYITVAEGRAVAIRPQKHTARTLGVVMKPALFCILTILLLSLPVLAQQSQTPQEATHQMSILIHITQGPEHPTRAVLGFLVARAAIEEGHMVTLFLAGDAVQLLRDGVLSNLVGLGTGNLQESYDAIVASGTTIYLSGMSARSRGLSEADLEGKPFQFATPNQLVQLALEHDRMFTY